MRRLLLPVGRQCTPFWREWLDGFFKIKRGNAFFGFVSFFFFRFFFVLLFLYLFSRLRSDRSLKRKKSHDVLYNLSRRQRDAWVNFFCCPLQSSIFRKFFMGWKTEYMVRGASVNYTCYCIELNIVLVYSTCVCMSDNTTNADLILPINRDHTS